MYSDLSLAPALIAFLFGMGCVVPSSGRPEPGQRSVTLLGVGLIGAALSGVSFCAWMDKLA